MLNKPSNDTSSQRPESVEVVAHLQKLNTVRKHARRPEFGRTSFVEACCRSLFTLALCSHILRSAVASKDPQTVFTDEEEFLHDDVHAETVAVKLSQADHGLADSIAAKHGYENKGQIGSLDGYYLFKKSTGHRITKRHAQETVGSDPDITWHELQVAKKRIKRGYESEDNVPPKFRSKRQQSVVKPPFIDPLYQNQWFLHGGAIGGFDMSVLGAWALGYSGKGVVVSILDDGIEPTHPDLAQNYDPRASKDINDNDDDPTPRDNGDNKHGTRCAGEVAAVAGNNWCGVGVAFNSSIGGVRMLDGPVSDNVEAASLSLNQDHIDIYSASWGPEDDGKTFDGPGPLAKEAFYRGVTKGRDGKGNIFIWASGNGGSHLDSCSCDGYTTSIYTLSISSATFNNQQPWYLEQCPSTLASTYSSAGAGQPAIVTVDMPHSCTDQHTGTSASAPLAAGIVALALEANPGLTWRDMQHLVMRTSDPTPLLANPGWVTNGVGRRVSSKFGYGLMHAENLVKLAKSWTAVPEQRVCTYEYHMDAPNPRPLIGKFSLNFSLPVAGCDIINAVNYLEQVHVLISAQLSVRGDLKISLVSPMGTKSVLLPPRPQDVTKVGFTRWPFLSVQMWGEDPRGLWTLIIENVGSAQNTGMLYDWTLVLYGTAEPAQPTDPPSSRVSDDEQPSAEQSGGEEPASSENASGQQTFHGHQHAFFNVCHTECTPNDGCYQPNSDAGCVKCLHYSLHKRNRGGVRCLAACETENGFWTDEKDKRCKQCMNECATCSTGDSCDSCRPPQMLVLSDPSDIRHGRCHKDCPDGFEKTASGKSCVPAKGNAAFVNSTKCTQGHFLSLDSHCVKQCPDGTYASVNQTCLRCTDACKNCIGATPLDCIECADGFQRGEDKSCQGITYMPMIPAVKSCQESGRYMDLIHTECRPCNPACSRCTGRLASECLRCSENHKNVSGVCVVAPKSALPSASTGFYSIFGLSLTKIAIIACSTIVAIFVLIFGFLMIKDRHYELNSKDYSYSPLPVKYALGGGGAKGSSPGHSPINASKAANGKSYTILEDDNDEGFNVMSDEDSDADTLFVANVKKNEKSLRL